MRNFLISIVTLLACLLLLKSVDAAVVWDGGTAVQTYKNGIKFGTKEIVKVDGTGEIKITDSNSVTRTVGKSEADFLLNRSFEKSHAGSPALSWSLSGATGTISTSSPIDGSQLLSLSLSNRLSLSQEITQTQFHPNLVTFSLWVKSSVADLQLCSTLETVEQECAKYDGSDQWKKLQVRVTAPSSGAMGLKLKSLTSTSGTVLVDGGEFSTNPLKTINDPTLETSIKYLSSNLTTSQTASDLTFQTSPGTRYLVTGQIVTYKTVGASGAPRVLFKDGDITVGSDVNRVRETVNGADSEMSHAVSFIYTASNSSLSFAFTVTASGDALYGDGTRNRTYIQLTKIGVSSKILTASDVVSSDTINWQFKGSASGNITDCGGADPIGTYTTYSKASNTFTQCASAPTTPPTNADGMYMYAGYWTEAAGCTTSITRFDICIGKGLKGLNVAGYTSTNKTGERADTTVSYESNTRVGLYQNYNEKTGILSLDSGTTFSSTINYAVFWRMTNPVFGIRRAYFHFTASKNPVISALDAVPRIDYSWENRFDLIVAGASETDPCTSDPCTIYGDIQSISTAANRSGTGIYTVTLNSSKIAARPFIEVSGTGDSISCSAKMISDYVASIECDHPGQGNPDTSFKLTITRRSDYRSVGDVAAVISQPTCYITDVKSSAISGGSASANTVQTRDLNTISGSCYFLSLANNQFTLEAGSYLIEASAPAYQVNRHQLFLHDGTDYVADGTSSYAYSPSVQTFSQLYYYGTLKGPKTFEVKHWTHYAVSLNGLGVAADNHSSNPQSYEVYTVVKVTKIK